MNCRQRALAALNHREPDRVPLDFGGRQTTLHFAAHLVELAADLDGVYRDADFITVHMPVTPETKGMINTAAFAKMKPGVRIVNCARGEIIHEADLQAALESGKVAGAALVLARALSICMSWYGPVRSMSSKGSI